MPVVRQYQQQVVEAPVPSIRVPTSAPAGAFTSPLGELAPIATQVSAQRDALTRKAEADADEMVVNEAQHKAVLASLDILQNPDTGALNKRGTNALKALPDAQEAWRTATSNIAGTLTTDYQREQFAKHAASQYDKMAEQIAAHTSAEVRKSDAATTQSLLTNGLTDVQNAPETADATAKDTKQRLVEYGQRAGWTPEILKEKVAAHVSDIHATAISSLVQQGTPEAVAKAKTYLEAHRAELVGGQLLDAEKLVDEGSGQSEGDTAADRILKTPPPATALPSEGEQQGLVTPGNIDLTNRPRVTNADGSISTVRSISIEEDGKTILIPTVINGKVVSDDAARAHYKATGEHLGTFTNEASAQQYAEKVHEQQARQIAGPQETPAEAERRAIAEAEQLPPGKARDRALIVIRAHFQDIERVNRRQRDEAQVTLSRQLEASGGRLNKASKEWLLIDGTPEGHQLLAQQKQILHPPPDPGNPDAYTASIALSGMAPDQFKLEGVKEWRSSGMNSGQINHLLTLQAMSHRHDLQVAESEAARYRHAAEAATAKGDTEAATLALGHQHTAEQMAARLRGSPLADESTIPFAALPAPTIPATPQMLKDLAQYGPGYAIVLARHGVILPKVLPVAPAPKP